jgi:hypothetical protein
MIVSGPGSSGCRAKPGGQVVEVGDVVGVASPGRPFGQFRLAQLLLDGGEGGGDALKLTDGLPEHRRVGAVEIGIFEYDPEVPDRGVRIRSVQGAVYAEQLEQNLVFFVLFDLHAAASFCCPAFAGLVIFLCRPSQGFLRDGDDRPVAQQGKAVETVCSSDRRAVAPSSGFNNQLMRPTPFA